MTAKQRALVVFHDNCTDGIAAAWCAHKALTELGYELVMFPANYGDGKPVPLELAATVDVTYMLDYSYKRAEMIAMSEVTQLLVIDHHASAQKECEGLDFCIFDMSRSGAGMSWDYFFPEEERPWFIDYVEDRDIWRWKYGNSREALAYIDTMPTLELETWYTLYNDTTGFYNLGNCVNKGVAVLAFVRQYNDEIIKQGARSINFEAPDGTLYRDIPYINVNYKSTSDVLNKLSKGHPFALGYFQTKDGTYKYSIRVSDSDFDASVLATLYGGGGHVKAAGFVIPTELKELKS